MINRFIYSQRHCAELPAYGFQSRFRSSLFILYLCCLWTLVALLSCGEATTHSVADNSAPTESSPIEKGEISSDMESYRSIFEQEIVVLFNSEGTNLDSTNMNIQTYINELGVEFIPVFSSPENLLKSTGGVELGNTIELNGYFFLAQDIGDERVRQLRINPTLSNESYVNIEALNSYFETEIAEKVAAMQAEQISKP